MSEIFGSFMCPHCRRKHDWVGELNNKLSEQSQKSILNNRKLQFARFSPTIPTGYEVKVTCPHCKENIQFNYFR